MEIGGRGACLLLALLAGPAGAQPAPMSLEDCVRAARESPSALGAARIQVDAAGVGVSRARTAFRPRARLLGAFTYNGTLPGSDGPPSFVALNGEREYLGVASAELELDTSGRLRAARDRAGADLDAATSGLRLAERELRLAVSASFYRLGLARRLAQVTRDSLDEARSFESRTRLLLEQGEASRADVAKAAAQVAVQQQAVEQADLEAELANHALAAFWTTDVTTPVPLRDGFDEPPPVPALALETGTDVPERPELGLLDARRRGLMAEARAARADGRPQTTVAFQYGIDSLRVSWADRGYALLVNVDVPVFDWGRTRDAARQLELEASGLTQRREELARGFTREVADAASRVRSGYAQLAATRAQVEQSTEDLRLSRLRFDGGEGPAIDVVTAQGQLAQARLNHYTAVSEYLMGLVDLELAAGR